MDWRYINTDLADPYFVTAADEAITIYRGKNLVPNTLHFYRRNQPTISIGRSQEISKNIFLPNAKKQQIILIRRTTGGGTIYTDPGCLIYSLIFPKTDLSTVSQKDIFKPICTNIITALSIFGIHADFKPPNDILINGKKIGGAGCIIKNQIILLHGTLLHTTNLTKLHQVLRIPPNATPVTTLQQETTNPPSINEIQQEIIQQFTYLFHTHFTLGTLITKEKDLITQLIQTRYQQQKWTNLR